MNIFSHSWRRSRRPQCGEVIISVVDGQAHVALGPIDRFALPSDKSKSKLRWPEKLWPAVGGLLALIIAFPHPVQAAPYTASGIVAATNAVRKENGLSALTTNLTLVAAAEAKSRDMLTHQYFNHTSPTGQTPWAWLRLVDYDFTEAGENLAKDFSNPTDLVQAWLASSGHRKNMLNDKFDEIGVTVIDGKLLGVNTTIVVAYFGSRTIVAPVEVATEPLPAEKNVQPAPTIGSIGLVLPEVMPTSQFDVALIPSLVQPLGIPVPTLKLTPTDPDPIYTLAPSPEPKVLGVSDSTLPSSLPLLMGLSGLAQVTTLLSWGILRRPRTAFSTGGHYDL